MHGLIRTANIALNDCQLEFFIYQSVYFCFYSFHPPHRPSWELAGVVTVIVTGLLLLVYGESEFDLLGFTLVMTASCLSGLRFTLTQVLLHGHGSEHGKQQLRGGAHGAHPGNLITCDCSKVLVQWPGCITCCVVVSIGSNETSLATMPVLSLSHAGTLLVCALSHICHWQQVHCELWEQQTLLAALACSS